MTFEFPGRPHLEGSSRIEKKTHPSLKDKAILYIDPVEMKDAGLIRCVTNKGSAEFELVVFAEEKVRNPKVEVISGDSVFVSWQAPSNAEGLLRDYSIVARDEVTNRVKNSEVIKSPSENGFESVILTSITPGNYKISFNAFYKSGQYESRVLCSTYNWFLHSEAWEGPELSIRASALTHDTVLVALQALDADNITGLEVTYSNSSVQNWTQVVMDEDVRQTSCVFIIFTALTYGMSQI
ncbi:hypothetical protein ElyMa_007006500 [Elysia marginata]|uniref:Fibronectin type-III domain-containing protein n=1 Tax=Elysia marginata TaxID=1093978 RepID=A0AAV4JP87_9GAST|nr:hypothetical protein ElyMa_007006500 [Elysia marginata]